MKIVCPRCEQDYVVELRVRRTGETLFACKECDATWFTRDAIGVAPFVDLGTYLKPKGIVTSREEIETIDDPNPIVSKRRR